MKKHIPHVDDLVVFLNTCIAENHGESPIRILYSLKGWAELYATEQSPRVELFTKDISPELDHALIALKLEPFDPMARATARRFGVAVPEPKLED